MSASFTRFLEKIKWIDRSELRFNLSKEEFLARLHPHLDTYTGQPGIFEAFNTSGNDYVGKITGDEIIMRRRRRMFDWTMGQVIVESHLKEAYGQVRVDSKIKFPGWIPGIIVAFFSLIYGMFLILAFVGVFEEDVPFMWAFILGHGLVLGSVFYLLFRKAISSGKYHFEKDLKKFVQTPR